MVLFGTHNRVRAPFAFEQLGVEAPERLRRLYSEATVGLSLSLTNYSLIPSEMLACGLPVVELAGRACEAVYGNDGSVITLARDDPADIAAQLGGLLDDSGAPRAPCPRPGWTSCGSAHGRRYRRRRSRRPLRAALARG